MTSHLGDTIFGVFLLPRHKPHSKGHQQKEEEERADAAGDVAVTDEECDVVAKRNVAFDYGRLPPWGRLNYFTGRRDDGTDSGVGTAGNCAAGFDCPEAGVAEVLSVARCITPPCIIGDDSHCLSSFADVVGVIFSVD